MTIVALLRTVENLGDHGREVAALHEVRADETVADLVARLSSSGRQTNVYDIIELRVVAP